MVRSRTSSDTISSDGWWGRRFTFRSDARTTSTPVFLLGFVPVWIDQLSPPLGISEAEQMLCSSGFNIGQLIVVGLVMISAYFVLKAVVRALNRQVRGGLYSLIAGLVPLFIPAFLTAMGIDTACLLPG